MITDLIYRCPVCGAFDWLSGPACRACHASILTPSATALTINGETRPLAHWYRRVLGFDLVPDSGGKILGSRCVRLSQEAEQGRYAGLGGIAAVHYSRRPLDTGVVTLFEKELVFSGSGSARHFPFDAIVSLTIESDTVILVTRTEGPLFFDFIEESGKKWEDCLRIALTRHHRPRHITEFFPRIRFRDQTKVPAQNRRQPAGKIQPKDSSGRQSAWVYGLVRFLARPLLRKLLPLTFRGMENVPAKGGAVLVANHSSFLDSILLEAFFPRHIWFMTKNSQYSHPALMWFLRLARSFPVRRYTVDPQAVRNAMKIVSSGHLLGIFPEGERNWDGTMLPFKRGTMRLVLALGKPVIPVGISGAYGLMPRWTHKISRVPVTVRIGAPMIIPRTPGASQTEADIAWVTGRLREAIAKLVDSQK